MQFDNNESGYFENQLLIATPSINGSCFDRSVIYLCAHNHEGAMGVIVNHTISNMRYGEVFDQLNIVSLPPVRENLVYFGGPVDPYRGFILHTVEGDTENPIGLSADISILHDIATGKGPGSSLFILGYAGWAAGQLESEIKAGSWLTAHASPDLIFHKDNATKWSLAAQTLGIDMLKMSGDVGHA